MGLIIISFIAFVSLGLPDGLLGVAWPGIRGYFDLPVDALGIILIFGTGGYMLSSFLNGMLMRRLGIGRLLS
ncbi:MAG: MFS transporter, partial [Nitrosomonadales bacterium]|nr:MFS transporter [Nitrosomonadales bacterium]